MIEEITYNDGSVTPCRPEGHCWHSMGVILTSDPPWTEQICCYCGLMRNVQLGAGSVGHGHGPHYPHNMRFWESDDEQLKAAVAKARGETE